MTSLARPRSRSLARATGERPAADPDSRALPAWPVLVLLWGYPVFWALGLLPFAVVLMAIPMIAFLTFRRRLGFVPGVLPWIGFAVWMIPASLMADNLGRMLGTGIRFSQFLALATTMIYIVNARRTLTPRRIMDGLTFIWVFVIVGGYLGMLFPEERLTYTVGILLPDFFTSNDYVNDLVFPPLAEIQTPWGGQEPFERPSAPFAYTNGWGAAIAVLTPIAVGTALAHRSARAMWFLVAGLVAIIPPAVATSNRGLFLGLAGAIAYIMLRLILRGKWMALLWVAILSVAGALILTMSGFLDEIIARQEAADTTTGRGNLYAETFERTLGSPILGYGAPRPSYWSEISIGTQGAIWNAMFCFGFVGLALFALMLLNGALRTIDAPNLSALWLHASVVVACGLSVFYGLDRQLVFVGIALAMMLREKYLGGSLYWAAQPTPFGRIGNAR
ncbi:O-antigen ligase domain-containing protein [Microbacterium sp. M3]|uniref:O-antigen ligase domain-containing protein n=1 Tax=Microbacterium arthrosphaerae TaxID=792652 RepID=A0ABU4H6U2_9MICO|nr:MULTISPECIES: O-antigen ligase domain-containing protein [Microbacterium]MDW4573604.1 O-antigen ligase domain-containing protein [Microbacterium arthrosphaerae]MDW7607459.1 O-antigen ligase domain-containing protein [Microbacterium sp. M3]